MFLEGALTICLIIEDEHQRNWRCDTALPVYKVEIHRSKQDVGISHLKIMCFSVSKKWTANSATRGLSASHLTVVLDPKEETNKYNWSPEGDMTHRDMHIYTRWGWLLSSPLNVCNHCKDILPSHLNLRWEIEAEQMSSKYSISQCWGPGEGLFLVCCYLLLEFISGALRSRSCPETWPICWVGRGRMWQWAASF